MMPNDDDLRSCSCSNPRSAVMNTSNASCFTSTWSFRSCQRDRKVSGRDGPRRLRLYAAQCRRLCRRAFQLIDCDIAAQFEKREEVLPGKVGKAARKSSMASPVSRKSMSVCTGTRVLAKQGVPCMTSLSMVTTPVSTFFCSVVIAVSIDRRSAAMAGQYGRLTSIPGVAFSAARSRLLSGRCRGHAVHRFGLASRPDAGERAADIRGSELNGEPTSFRCK